MRRARFLALTSALALGAGCDSGEGPIGVGGTVSSVSPGSTAPMLVGLQWLYDDEKGADTAATAVAVPVQAPFPASFDFSVDEPAHWYADFDFLRTLPRCSTEPVQHQARCWDDQNPPLMGRGKLAIGMVIVFADIDRNNRWTPTAQGEPVGAVGSTFLFYAKDLDAQAIKELGEMMLLNPQALRPGVNFAKVRCKEKVGWTKDRFDPFEIVPAESIEVESAEALSKQPELCWNWT